MVGRQQRRAVLAAPAREPGERIFRRIDQQAIRPDKVTLKRSGGLEASLALEQRAASGWS